MSKADLNLTPYRRELLANVLFEAYYAGWDGVSLRDWDRRPQLDVWRRNDASASGEFHHHGIAKGFSHKPRYRRYLTRKGIELAEEIHREDRGSEAKEAAAAALKAEAEEKAKTERKVRRASYLFRGLKLRELDGLKPEAVSTMMAHKRVDDGFGLTLKLDHLVELGEQIEKLRG